MMKKIGIFALVIALIICIIPIRSLAEKEYTKEDYIAMGMPSDWAEIKARGVLRIGILSTDQVGFYMQDEHGKLDGFDIDVARNVAASLHLEPEFIRIEGGYDGLLMATANGDVDICLSTFSNTIDRLQYINFSRPYLTTNYATIVNKSAMVKAKVKTNPIPYMKANEVDIALQQGTSHISRVKSLFPKANIIETKDASEAVSMVIKGEAFATLTSESELFVYCLSDPSSSIYTNGYSFNDVNDEFCIGVNKDYPTLLSMINLYLDTSKQLSEKEIENWFYEYLTKEE